MDNTKDSGAAFPYSGMATWGGQTMQMVHQSGMTLRDYFAAQFLTTIVIPDANGAPADKVAQMCYTMADAMLRERAK